VFGHRKDSVLKGKGKNRAGWEKCSFQDISTFTIKIDQINGITIRSHEESKVQ
jgi:hypothetical protein